MKFRLLRDPAKKVQVTPTQTEFETQQDRLMKLSGDVLSRYRKELAQEVAEPERLNAVYGQRFLEREMRDQAQIVAHMASELLMVPNAMVNIVLSDRQVTVAQVGSYASPEVAREESYCQHVIGTGRELAITDSARHPLVCDTTFAQNAAIVSYLGVPVVSREGMIVGVLCCWDSIKRDWDAADVGILTQLSMVLTRVGVKA
jgi:GAF domain-containing protein